MADDERPASVPGRDEARRAEDSARALFVDPAHRERIAAATRAMAEAAPPSTPAIPDRSPSSAPAGAGETIPEVFWWATASQAQRDRAMIRLEYWVEWAGVVYPLFDAIRPCWVLHPELVQELWALMCLHYALHTIPGRDGLSGPTTFAMNFSAWLGRVKTTYPDLAGCAGEHHPSPWLEADPDRRRVFYTDPTPSRFTWQWPSTPAPEGCAP